MKIIYQSKDTMGGGISKLVNRQYAITSFLRTYCKKDKV
jgi:hypothetical protein